MKDPEDNLYTCRESIYHTHGTCEIKLDTAPHPCYNTHNNRT